MSLLPSYDWCFLIWLAAFVIQAFRAIRGRPTVGLSLAMTGSLALVHLIAEVCYVLADFQSGERADSRLGFRISAVGVLGFASGTLLADAWLARRVEAPARTGRIVSRALAFQYIVLGVVLYGVTILGRLAVIPGLSAIFGASMYIIVAGVLLMWQHYQQSNRMELAWLWALSLLGLPVAGMVLQGFVGFGTTAMIVAFSFLLARTRFRWWTIPLGLATIYLGLSFWVNYAQVRTEFRRRVWLENTQLQDRFNFLFDEVLGQFEWFRLDQPQQLAHLERLDQNWLIGRSAVYIAYGGAAFGNGATFVDALLALVPRVIWREKPVYGGSGTIVTQYTGVRFEQGTSVGVGQIMELYVNYDLPAVLIGMLLVGFVITALDIAAGRHLNGQRGGEFMALFVVAQPLMQVQGNYAETTAGMFGAYLLMQAIRWFLPNPEREPQP